MKSERGEVERKYSGCGEILRYGAWVWRLLDCFFLFHFIVRVGIQGIVEHTFISSPSKIQTFYSFLMPSTELAKYVANILYFRKALLYSQRECINIRGMP